MSGWSFWSHPLWIRYCEAEGKPWRDNRGAMGNLTLPLYARDEMWGRISDGTRSDIRHAEKGGPRHYLDFASYEDLHRRAYSEPRPPATYFVQSEMCRKGIGWIEGIGDASHVFASSLWFWMMADPGPSYYASAVRCPDHPHRGAAALCVWLAMLFLADAGARYIDMGPLPDTASVVAFKRHMGARPPLVETGPAHWLGRGVAP